MNALAATPLADGLAETFFMTRKAKRILLVEDNDCDGELAEIMMRKIGCEVSMAKGGREALDFVRNNEFDLCIVDLGLPDMCGLDVATQIQAIHPRMIIVIYSGFHENPLLRDALDNGFTILGKPLRPQNLLCLLNRPSAIGY